MEVKLPFEKLFFRCRLPVYVSTTETNIKSGFE